MVRSLKKSLTFISRPSHEAAPPQSLSLGSATLHPLTRMKIDSPGKIAGLVIFSLLICVVLKQIFDEGGDSTRGRAAPPAATPQPAIGQISCITTRYGDKATAAKFENTTGKQLDEVNAIFTFKTENTKDVTIKRYWLSWAPGENKEFSLENESGLLGIFIEKITLSGTCTQGRLDSSWLGGPNADKRGYDSDSKETPEEQGRRKASLASLGHTREPKETLITHQTDKVKKLQEALTAQYKELEAKRSTLKEGGEIDQFNKDAAEYAQRLLELRNEEAYLKGLTEKPKSQF